MINIVVRYDKTHTQSYQQTIMIIHTCKQSYNHIEIYEHGSSRANIEQSCQDNFYSGVRVIIENNISNSYQNRI